MNNVSELALHYLQSYGLPAPETYTAFLREACEAHPPPHGMAWYGNMYRQLARKTEWFANSLIINADKEGFGARQLWKFSVRMENTRLAEAVRRHSMDESKHARIFVGTLDLLFPSALEAGFRAQLRELSPGYNPRTHPPTNLAPASELLPERRVMDDLIQGNFTEVRALILQLLLRPMFQAYAAPEKRARLLHISDGLIRDEARHIEYSAQFIEQYAAQGNREWVRATMLDRMKSVNDVSLAEVSVEGQPIPL
jgi:hypothetical protein